MAQEVLILSHPLYQEFFDRLQVNDLGIFKGRIRDRKKLQFRNLHDEGILDRYEVASFTGFRDLDPRFYLGTLEDIFYYLPRLKQNLREITFPQNFGNSYTISTQEMIEITRSCYSSFLPITIFKGKYEFSEAEYNINSRTIIPLRPRKVKYLP